MIFGKNRDKGLILVGRTLKVVKIGEGGITEKDILIHDAEEENPGLHSMLIDMKYPELPIALGVIRAVKDKTMTHVRIRLLMGRTCTIPNMTNS